MTLRKPVWTEGLFLTQHHFQQHDRYVEALLRSRWDAAYPLAYGLSELDVDVQALERGSFELRRLVAVLPDGTTVRCGDGAWPLPPARAYDAAFSAQLPALPVFVGLPKERSQQPNVELEPAEAPQGARYVRAEEQVYDYNTAGTHLAVPWARPNLRILFASDRTEDYDLLPIAELERTSSGVRLRHEFVPPVCRLGASPFLLKGIERLAKAAAARRRELSASLRRRKQGELELGPTDVLKFWMLDALGDSGAVFEHFVASPSVHPERAYVELARLVGRLNTYARQPAVIPAFDHLGSSAVFRALFESASTLIQTLIPESYLKVLLRPESEGLLVGQLDGMPLDFEFYVGASGPLPESELRDRVSRFTKIAAPGAIQSLIKSQKTGLSLQHAERAPSSLPLGPEIEFFRLERSGSSDDARQLWSGIQQSREIALWYPTSEGKLKIELYAIEARH